MLKTDTLSSVPVEGTCFLKPSAEAEVEKNNGFMKRVDNFPSLEFLVFDMECSFFPELRNDPTSVDVPETARAAFNLTLDPALWLAIRDRIASNQKIRPATKVGALFPLAPQPG